MLKAGWQRRLFFAVLILGTILRVFQAWRFETRAWIDEIWVVLDPAYRMLTGVGPVERDWTWQVRDWLPPSLVFLQFKVLNALGVTAGPAVLAAIRIRSAFATCVGLAAFAWMLGRRFGLREAPWLAALVLFFIPELIHLGGTADLSALGLPPLLLGTALLFWDNTREASWLTRVGGALVVFSALIRFQYGIFPAVFLCGMLWRREWRKATELAFTGCAFLLFDFAFNSWMYGNAVLPIARYFLVNTSGGVASSYGVTPFYFAFEILWRFTTEPVFAIAVLTLPLAYRRAPALTAAAVLFFVLHALIAHKEFRFFYGGAVVLSGIGAAALQVWAENLPPKRGILVLFAFASVFLTIAGFRASRKVDWHAYEIPARLETYAGTLPDVRGLITYGWGGIYQGCNYVFYRPLPCVFAENLAQLKFKKLNAEEYSHVVTGAEEAAPCADLLRKENGGALYRCTNAELKKLFAHP